MTNDEEPSDRRVRQGARPGRKLLESLITHIKAGTRVAITAMHLRICGGRKRQA